MNAVRWLLAAVVAGLLWWHPDCWLAAAAGGVVAIATTTAGARLHVALALGLACLALSYRDPAALLPVVLVAVLTLAAWPLRALPLTEGPLAVEVMRRSRAWTRMPAMALGVALLVRMAWPFPDAWVVALLAISFAIEVSGDAPRCLAALGIGAAIGGGAPAGVVLAAGAISCCTWPPRQPPALPWLAGAGFAVLAAGLQLPASIWVAPLAAAALWLLLPDAGGSPHRTLPPLWRWFAWCKLRMDPVFVQLAARERRFGRVLDVGCGFGLGAWLCDRRGDATAWTGVDLDRGKLAVASRLCGRLWLSCSLYAARVPGPQLARADTILALDLLHYWPPDEQLLMLRWMAGQLAVDGVLYLREGLREVAGAAVVAAGERFTTAVGLNPRQPLHFLGEAELRGLFAAAGLAVMRCQPSGGGNRLWELRVAEVQAVVMDACTSDLRSRPSTAPAVMQPPMSDPRMPG